MIIDLGDLDRCPCAVVCAVETEDLHGVNESCATTPLNRVAFTYGEQLIPLPQVGDDDFFGVRLFPVNHV